MSYFFQVLQNVVNPYFEICTNIQWDRSSWYAFLLTADVLRFFFQKVRCVFQITKINTPNHYPELEIWITLLLLWVGNSKFKLTIVIWNTYLFWRFDKHIALSEKKLSLARLSKKLENVFFWNTSFLKSESSKIKAFLRQRSLTFYRHVSWMIFFTLVESTFVESEIKFADFRFFLTYKIVLCCHLFCLV